DWSASTVLAGTGAGADTKEGTNDDAKLNGPGIHDNASIFSRIASVVIKGTATGSPGAGDGFGIIAEEIVKGQAGATQFASTKGPRTAGDFFTIGASNDFSIGEVTI